MRKHRLLLLWFAIVVTLTPTFAHARRRHRKDIPMVATAYAQHGRTASGVVAQRGIVAADPRVLPLGSRVRVKGAGPYSGDYRVMDTGRRIRGHRIDVYMPSPAEARRFGVKHVRVEPVKPSAP